MEYKRKLEEFKTIKLSQIIDGRSRDILTWIHGAVYGRSALGADPSTLVSSDPIRLEARFQNKPGYALFQDKLYLVQFGFRQPIVTPIKISDHVSKEELDAIKASFPAESEPLSTYSEEELHTFQEQLEPLPDMLTESFSFNTELLHSYFTHYHPDGVPFLEFSDMGLFKVPDNTKLEDLPKIIQGIINKDAPYQSLPDDYLDIPLVIAVGNHYYAYGNTQGNQWTLTKLESSNFDKRHLPFTKTPCRLPYDRQHFPIYQDIFEKHAHTHFSDQPQQVSQLKKLLNSAHYFKLLSQDAENLDISFFSLSGLYSMWKAASDLKSGQTYDKAYCAIALLTDVDIDFSQRFREEISEFNVLLDRFKYYSKMGKAALPTATQQTYKPSISFQAGNALSFMTRNIYDPNGQWDIDVLSQLSVDLPKHIDLLTTKINANTASVTQHAPNINAAQLKALQKEATKLLKTLKGTQKTAALGKRNPLNPFYQVYQIVNYAILISQIIRLITTTLTQVGHLSDAYQELLRTYLKILKTTLLIVIKHADRIEIEFTLTPGAVSRPVLRKLTGFHHYIGDHVKGLADFSFRGEELLILEDSQFVAEREENIHTMLQESGSAKQRISWAQEAMQNFLNHLFRPDTNRRALREHYAKLGPYLQQINPELHKQTLGILNNEHGDITSLIPKWKSIRVQISSHLSKLQNTETMRQQQMFALLAAIPKYTNLQLFPYHERMGCEIALKIVNNLPLKSLKLPNLDPILIRHHEKGITTYVFYGNQDGTKWGFSPPIDEQFLDRGILRHFARLEKKMSSPDYDPNQADILPYLTKYQSLYQQMIIKRAHTHYRSQFSSLESSVLSEEPESLTQMIFKPLDWIESKVRPQMATLVGETPTTENAHPDTSITIASISHSTDRVTNLENLSAAQALKIHFWYQHKIEAYKEACSNLLKLQRLINQNFTAQSKIEFATRSTAQKQCLYLYHNLRPYLIGLWNFPLFDHKMVRALSVAPTERNPRTAAITCNELNLIFDRFSLLNQAKTIVTSWETRAALLLCHAQTHYQKEQENALTTRRASITADPRANFLLRTTELSKKIREFRESVGLWALILHPKIRDQLDINFLLAELKGEELAALKTQLGQQDRKIAGATLANYQSLRFSVTELLAIKKILDTTPDGIQLSHKFVIEPVLYVDIRDLNTQLRHPPFVLLIKRIFNTVYHLQHVAEGIEKIEAGYSDKIKNETIDLVISLTSTHGVELSDLIVQLRDDPLITQIASDLYQQSENIVQKVCNLIQPHTTAITQVHPRVETAASNGLWHTMNSFFVVPHHLLTLTEQRDSSFGYGITLITDTNATIMTPAHKQLSLILHHQNYYIYGNGTGNEWAIHRLPHELITPLDIDFAQAHLDYDYRYQALYDYLLEHQYHFTHLNQLQISAKQTTLNIEQLIDNAVNRRNFRLFCSLPMVYRLNKALQAQAEIFTRTTQDTIMSHLAILKSEYFPRLLLAADDREQAWGTIQGEISEPLQAIFDEIYQGLVFQLKFDHFSAREDLIVSSELLLKRILAEEKRLASFARLNVEQERNYRTLDEFTQALTAFKNGLAYKLLESISGQKPVPEELGLQYRMLVIPLLNTYRSSFVPEWIADIPTTVDAAHLRAIKKQVSTYHKHLSASFLLHHDEARALCQTLQTFLARLNQIPSATTASVPSDLDNQYLREVMPALEKHRTSHIPDWLVTISPDLDRNSMDKIFEQSNAYFSHLSGLVVNRNLYHDRSLDKLLYLWQKLGVDPATIRSENPKFEALKETHDREELPLSLSNIEKFRPNIVSCRQAIAQQDAANRLKYRQSFAKHYFHTYVNRIPYQASGLSHNKIHREYHRELRLYLIQHETNILENAETYTDLDTQLNTRLQKKIETFQHHYFERYQRLDRMQTAVNEFQNYLKQDQRIPERLRDKKLGCLNAMDDLILQCDRGDRDLETFLNQRSQLLCQVITHSEDTLLEHHREFPNVFYWLLDCLIALLSAMGLYTPERQRRYANLVSANQPQQHLPRTWLQFFTFQPAARSPEPRNPAATPVQVQG
ncbi:MAG: hypothetical protein NTU48_07505 [Legionellales bacterium]|nr:hypothetical protein [Legionellales bacterium]